VFLDIGLQNAPCGFGYFGIPERKIKDVLLLDGPVGDDDGGNAHFEIGKYEVYVVRLAVIEFF
jgi:hypothetical protein